MTWREFDNGRSLGCIGCEAGTIMRDDEHVGGARITLERDGKIAPFAITCGVYGWMVHTRFFESEPEANNEFESMQVALTKLMAVEFKSDTEHLTEMIHTINGFVDRFP